MRKACVRYVIVDAGRAPAGLREMAIDVLKLMPVYRDGPLELLTPKDPPSCDPAPKRRRKLLP